MEPQAALSPETADTTVSPETINLLVVPSHGPRREKILKDENRNLTMMCMQTKRLSNQPRLAEEFATRIKDAQTYLTWLDFSQDAITYKDVKGTNLRQILLLVTKEQHKPFLPEGLIEKCERLAAVFESIENTTNEQDGDEITSDGEHSDTAEATSQTLSGTAVTSIPLPPANHPIYGVNGIMHGLIAFRGKNNRVVRKINPSLVKKPFQVYGHNGIALGSWYPLKISANFYGAHGAVGGGISGDVELGAYSIIVSETYNDLDKDEGDTIYYSGSNSHENDDPTKPAESSMGTRTLKASQRTHRPVRVLRAGGSTTTKTAANKYLPPAGLRYDGLYEVVERRLPKNTKGGLFEQFVLQRLPGQTSLNELRRTSPSAQQLRDLREIQQGY